MIPEKRDQHVIKHRLGTPVAISRNAQTEITSAVTAGFRTTIPKAIRGHLGLNSGDTLLFTVDPSGRVTLQQAKPHAPTPPDQRHTGDPRPPAELDEEQWPHPAAQQLDLRSSGLDLMD